MVSCPEDVECVTTTSTTTIPVTTAAAIAPESYTESSLTPGDSTNSTTIASSNETAVAQDFVPLKFSVFGVSEDAEEDTVKSEMKGILEMILFELEELNKDSGLKILDIVAWGRRELNLRAMSPPYEMMFNVAVLPMDGVDLGTFIIDGIRDQYDSLVLDVRGWTDSEYVTNDFGFDVCAYSMESGGYDNCASGETPASVATDGGTTDYGGSSYTYTESDAIDSTPLTVESANNTTTEKGMSTMMIIIISVVSVLLFCCIVSIILFIGCRKDDSSWYDDYSEDKSRDKRYSEGESSRSTSEHSENEMVRYNENPASSSGYPEKCYVDEEEHVSDVLPKSSVIPIPPAMTGGGSVRSNGSAPKASASSHRSHRSSSHKSSSKARGDASHSSRSHSSYNRPSAKDPSVYMHREGAEDPSVQSRTRRADPSVYNPKAADPNEYDPNVREPDARSAYSRDRFSHELESLGSGSRGTGKKSSVRMDYSVVSELSEPSITARFS
jgi:hypothetical protein